MALLDSAVKEAGAETQQAISTIAEDLHGVLDRINGTRVVIVDAPGGGIAGLELVIPPRKT
jgi:hypothetical protein